MAFGRSGTPDGGRQIRPMDRGAPPKWRWAINSYTLESKDRSRRSTVVAGVKSERTVFQTKAVPIMATSSTPTQSPRRSPTPGPQSSPIPPLENGDHLSRAEFERRYDAMPDLKKAELIQGIVFMGSPVRVHHHGVPHFDLIGLFFIYGLSTPGLIKADNSTTRLGDDSEPQPDILLMIEPARGGQARISDDNYVEGAPELVAEIASSSVSFDLHLKKKLYKEYGAREYVVWRVLDKEVDWFVLRNGEFEPLPTGPDGILRSEVFPGLWLDPAAMIRGDMAAAVAVLRQGLASPEHAAFVDRLKPTQGS